MRLARALLFVLPSLARAGGIGTGYGETLWALTSARQTGTGGIAVEDPWRQGRIVEATTILMQPGPRWAGLSAQGGFGPSLRLGADGFMFQSPTVARTSEFPDGSYAGSQGTVNAQEWGGRVTGQMNVWSQDAWRVAALGLVSGLAQQLPDAHHYGAAVEAGATAQRLLDTAGRALTAWGLVGPLGVAGGGRWFNGELLAGAGYVARLDQPMLGRGQGVGTGAEVQVLSEGLLHGGAGAVYWLGDAREAGVTYFLRAGLRYAQASAAPVQPRAGLGVLWRGLKGWGLQFDYAFVPLGDLGVTHYATLGLRLEEFSR